MSDNENDYEKYLKSLIDPSALKGAGAAEPKLTFDQRCVILAADKMGMKRTAIAAAFNIARPTVAYICNPSSRHYRNVRKEYEEMGKTAFMAKYMTPEYVKLINDASHTIRAKATDADDKELRQFEAAQSGPHRSAKGNEGRHRFWDPLSNVAISVVIEWLNPDHPYEDPVLAFAGPGWYVIFDGATMKAAFNMDHGSGLWPGDQIAYDGKPPFPTSQAALKAFKAMNPHYEEASE